MFAHKGPGKNPAARPAVTRESRSSRGQGSSSTVAGYKTTTTGPLIGELAQQEAV